MLEKNQERLNNPNKSHSSEMWPTPTTQEVEHPQAELTENGRRKSKDGNSSHSLNLADSVKMWPTPTTMDTKEDSLKHATKLMQGKTHRASGEPIQKTLADKVMMEEIKKDPSLMDHYKDHEMIVRPELPAQEEFVKYLRENTTIKELTQKTDIKKTTIEHWFRKDQKGFSHPSIEDWNKIKPYLKTIKYDKEMTMVQTAEWTRKMWPTPSAGMWKQDVNDNGEYAQRVKDNGHQVMLPSAVKLEQRKTMWPTPRARDYKDGKKVPPSVGKTRSHTLATKVIQENQKVMWPTPTTKGYGHASEGQTLMLRKMVEEGVLTELEAEQMMNGTTLRPPRMVKWNFPTPTARDHLMPRKPETMAKTGRNPETNSLPDAIQHLEMFPTPTANEDAAGKAGGNMQKMLGNDPKVRNTGEGTLASEWVELLMGYPKGWTDLKNQDASLKNVRVIWDENWEKDTPRVAVGQKDRMKRLKGLGNAIVPQIAEMIGKAIMESENDI